MVDQLVKHPYSDARNAVVVALALWTLAVALAATSGALERMGPAPVASLLVFLSGVAVAATTMDRRIGAWIASWAPVASVAGSGASRGMAAVVAVAAAFALVMAAQALSSGSPARVAAGLLVAIPVASGLAGGLAAAWVRGAGRAFRSPGSQPLAVPRGAR